MKDKASRKHIRGSAVLFTGRLISVALNAILQVLIVRYLVKADYGAFAYVLNFVEIVGILTLIGLDQATSRYIPIYLENKDYNSLFGLIVLSVSTILGIGLGVAFLLIGTQNFVMGEFIKDKLTLNLLMLMILLAPIQAMDGWFQSLFAAFSHVRAIFFRRYLLAPGLKLLVVILVILTDSNVYTLAGGYLLASLVGNLMYVWMFFSLMRKRDILQFFRLPTLQFNARVIYGFSVPILSSAVVLIFRSQLAVVFLEYFKDVTAVAEYRAVQPIARLNSVVYQSFVFLYLPLATRMFERKDKEGINDLYWRTTAWIALASFPAFIVTSVLAWETVPTLLGEQYQNSSIVMAIMAIGYYFNALMGFNLYTIRAYGKVRILVGVDIIVLVAVLISYVTFIPAYGATGAALSFTFAIMLANTLNHTLMARYTDINLFDPTFLPVYVTIGIAIVGIALLQFILHASLFISIPITGVVWLGLLRINASRLQVGEIFPELTKVPILKQLIKA